MTGISRIEFMLYYSVFLVFVFFISGMASVDILGDANLAAFPQPSGLWWHDWALPFVYFWSFLSISSESALLFTLIIMPFIIGVIVIMSEMIRGN